MDEVNEVGNNVLKRLLWRPFITGNVDDYALMRWTKVDYFLTPLPQLLLNECKFCSEHILPQHRLLLPPVRQGLPTLPQSLIEGRPIFFAGCLTRGRAGAHTRRLRLSAHRQGNWRGGRWQLPVTSDGDVTIVLCVPNSLRPHHLSNTTTSCNPTFGTTTCAVFSCRVIFNSLFSRSGREARVTGRRTVRRTDSPLGLPQSRHEPLRL